MTTDSMGETVAILITVIFATADAVGLWALNHVDPNIHIIFSDTSTGQHQPIGGIGQP
ncbi:MAG TPA: hypothetical protein VGL88_08325 [Pseudonocardiaceae bacterium]|jgi:hypothetical protein